MLNKAFGLIYTGESDMELKDLTFSRAVAAMPVGGRYRAIDFLISNLVNSGIRNVGIIAQRNYHSLMDHVGTGKEWDLARKRDGLFMLPPFVTRENTGGYKGSVDALKSVMGYVRRSSQKYCIFMGSHTLYNTTYNKALDFHEQSGADITILYNKAEKKPAGTQRLYLHMDENARVTDMELDPAWSSSEYLGMDVYIMEKNLLEYLVEECVSHLGNDFIRDILFKKLANLRIFGYEYDGLVARINTLEGYYNLNMSLLEEKIRNDFFFHEGMVYTKVKDEVPAFYRHGALAKHSLVADGCIIEGEIENCVLFRSVKIGKGAKLKNCIIMQGSEVQENAELEYVILDKNVVVKPERRMVGQENFPIIIRKNATI